MRQSVRSHNVSDANGNPTGGSTQGVGIEITWQNGPLAKDSNGIAMQNGAFVEGVIQAAIERLEFFQSSKFACAENEKAIIHLHSALQALDSRTERRRVDGTEGTHNGN